MNRTAKIRLNPQWRTTLASILFVAAALLLSDSARSQSLDANELEELIGPIALYPDDVLGIILPASTFPLDIVRAARFLDDLEQDSTLEPDPDWDASVVALLNYPEILRMMSEDLDWTWALGEAVLTDEAAVLAAAQDFRSRALAAGNLASDDRQIVDQSDGAIEIRPADPEVVYIPVYEPAEVVVYQPRYVYRYYPIGYPVYYYPYPSGYFYPSSFFWGVTSYFSIGWHTHHLHVHHHSHFSHPYYLNSYYYYRPYYYRSNVILTVSIGNTSNVWRASPRRGVRPRTLTVESRVSEARTRRTRTVESQPNLTRTRASNGSRGLTTRSVEQTQATRSMSRQGSGSQIGRTRGNAPAAIGGRVEPSRTGTRGANEQARTRSPGNSSAQIRGSVRTRTTPATPRTTTRTAPPTRVVPQTRTAPRASMSSRTTRTSPPARAATTRSTGSSRSNGSSIGRVQRSAPTRTAAAPRPSTGSRAPTRSSRSSASSSSGRTRGAR